MKDENVVEAVVDETGMAVIEAEVLALEPQAHVAPDRIAVETAKAHPRSIEEFRKTLAVLATVDQPSADSMYYTLKRGKMIEGPTIRFAECVLYAFGNIRTYGRIVEVGATELVAEGGAWDMQQNNQVSRQVRRRITYSDGSRYNQDMISVTANAAISIAIRNAILTIVPRPWYNAAYEAALEVAVGDKKSVEQHRKEWMKWWKDQGGTDDQLWEWLEIKGSDDIGGFQLRSLNGLRNAIVDGHTTFQREMDILAGATSGEEEADALDAILMNEEKES